VIFLDSWVWVEYLFSGDKDAAAAAAIDRANAPDEGGLITPTILAEVSYRIRVVEDETTAEETVRAMRAYEYIDSVPLIDAIDEYAAALRFKYYAPGEEMYPTRMRYTSRPPFATTSATPSIRVILTSTGLMRLRRLSCGLAVMLSTSMRDCRSRTGSDPCAIVLPVMSLVQSRL